MSYKNFTQLSKNERTFYNYCVKKIDSAIKKKRDSTDILFTESKEMRELYLNSIQNIYFLLQSYYFNQHDIGISFGGWDMGSEVVIRYPKSIKEVDFNDADFIHNYRLMLTTYLNHLDDYSHNHKPNLKPMCGDLWYHMYLDLKRVLKKCDYTLILDDKDLYLPKKLNQMERF